MGDLLHPSGSVLGNVLSDCGGSPLCGLFCVTPMRKEALSFCSHSTGESLLSQQLPCDSSSSLSSSGSAKQWAIYSRPIL